MASVQPPVYGSVFAAYQALKPIVAPILHRVIIALLTSEAPPPLVVGAAKLQLTYEIYYPRRFYNAETKFTPQKLRRLSSTVTDHRRRSSTIVDYR